jgi:putative transposase
MRLFINMLVEWLLPADESVESHVERILWIDTISNEVITINIFDKNAFPKKRSREEIINAIRINEARILQTDPYAALMCPEENIKSVHRIRRDKAWALIAELLSKEDIHFLLDSSLRGPLIAAVARSKGCSKRTIYLFIRRYWQAGKIKNALLPAYSKCGGRGKRRLADNPDAPKLGRRSALAKATGQSIGVRITKDIERRFERGIKQFYEKEKAGGLKRAYELTKEKYFNDGYKLDNGALIPLLPPAETLPSYDQFRYWYRTVYREVRREVKLRQGEREYNLRSRELLGDSSHMAPGPGSQYQIDATIGDIYLVSSFDSNRIIGRPIIYICIDTFSRMITGFSVTLEGPSWLGAMLALDNVVADKVAFCAEYGIRIDKDEWPCHHLPESILADRGEFEGYNADNLVNSLGTRIGTTAAWRPDWKPIVERSFKTSKDEFIKFLPGAIYEPRQRGGRDYRLDAALTLNEFRKLFILHIINYNNNHYMKTYKKSEFMIADHVARYPLDIWQWGIRNSSGHLRILPREIVRLNLLPRKKVSVTPYGIHFEKGLYYTCDIAIQEGWFVKARTQGSWKVEVSYDPRSVNIIYLGLDNGRRIEPCQLTAPCHAFVNRDLYEAMDYFALESQAEEKSRTRRQNSNAATRAHQAKLISEATEKRLNTRALVGKSSKAARIKAIRDNRGVERLHERDEGSWNLQPEHPEIGLLTDQLTNSTVADEIKEEDNYIPPSSKADQIRTLRNKDWEDDI